ncbi:MAG: tetratricopeptide repeat protein [Bacteroidetes bacterium]|nr:tetratricopeptide repeat protein [Bacteroidota bacterium]
MLNIISKIALSLLFLIYSINGNSKSQVHLISKKHNEDNNIEKVEALSDLCWNLRERSKDSSLIYGIKAINLADSLGYYKQKAKVCNYVGVVYMHYIKDVKAAIPYYHDALEAAYRVNDTLQIGYAYNNLGDAFYLIGNIPLALKYGKNSLHYFQQLNNKRGLAYSYINLGLAYRKDHKYDLSIKFFKQAISLRKEIEDSIGIASAHYEIGVSYFEKNDLDKACRYFQESIILHKKLDNKMYIALSLNGIADVLFEKGDYKKALTNYYESLKYNREGNHKEGIIQNKLGIALIYSLIGKRAQGKEQLQEAIQQAKKLGYSSNILISYKTSAKFYENIGDFESASKSYKRYLSVYDSLYSVQQFEALIEMENRFNISQKLNEINQHLEQRRRDALYLTIILTLVVGVVLILLWRFIVIRRLSNQLRQINDSKDKLFSIISHDLKAPFNSMLGFSSLMVKELEHTDNDRIKKYSRYIDQMSTQTVELINNLTSWSRSQRGLIKLSKTEFNLSELIEKIVDLNRSNTSKKGIEIKNTVKSDMIVRADKDILRTIITNLITNAIKFTGKDGLIKIKAIKQKDQIKISIRDNGVGIQKNDIKKLFSVKDNFTTIGTNNEQGTGLGLIICKEFTEMHGGNIEVLSEPNMGSEFIVTLPL